MIAPMLHITRFRGEKKYKKINMALIYLQLTHQCTKCRVVAKLIRTILSLLPEPFYVLLCNQKLEKGIRRIFRFLRAFQLVSSAHNPCKRRGKKITCANHSL